MKGKAIVFGGSGFLGSHVADALTDAGHNVVIFDVMKSPYLRDGQEMIVGDICDPVQVKSAAHGCDFVYNFAGIADIGSASARPVDVTKVNVMGNVNVLEAAVAAKAKRFIFASTVYVFSDQGSFYRVSKQAGERFVEAYAEAYNLPYTILRYGSLYGRRASEWNGIHRIIRQALQDKAIVYMGSPDAMREYVHVKDAARLSVDILDARHTNRHIIITGPERLAVKSLLRMVSEMVPGGVPVRYEETHADGHYVMAPYTFNPRIGHKLIATDHIDIGQGLLDCMSEIFESTHPDLQKDGDLLVKNNGK